MCSRADCRSKRVEAKPFGYESERRAIVLAELVFVSFFGDFIAIRFSLLTLRKVGAQQERLVQLAEKWTTTIKRAIRSRQVAGLCSCVKFSVADAFVRRSTNEAESQFIVFYKAEFVAKSGNCLHTNNLRLRLHNPSLDMSNLLHIHCYFSLSDMSVEQMNFQLEKVDQIILRTMDQSRRITSIGGRRTKSSSRLCLQLPKVSVSSKCKIDHLCVCG